MSDGPADPADGAAKLSATHGRSRRPGQQPPCGWCGQPITMRGTGRTPKWCSATCRHRAWEQTRAAASGRSAVTVVDRTIEVEVPRQVQRMIEVEVLRHPRGAEWVDALQDLVGQVDTGRVYDRDIPAIARTIALLVDALDRRRRGRR